MYPVSFSDKEVVYAKNQPQYNPLPAEKWKDGKVLSKWKLSWRERLNILLNGSIYLLISTFNYPLQPVRMSVKRPIEKGNENG